MAELGLKAYRFSIAWGRVLPDGKGESIQRESISIRDWSTRCSRTEYAERHTVSLGSSGGARRPGGWLNRDIAGWFGDYASTMFDALGDRVPMWSTINEPWW